MRASAAGAGRASCRPRLRSHRPPVDRANPSSDPSSKARPGRSREGRQRSHADSTELQLVRLRAGRGGGGRSTSAPAAGPRRELRRGAGRRSDPKEGRLTDAFLEGDGPMGFDPSFRSPPAGVEASPGCSARCGLRRRPPPSRAASGRPSARRPADAAGLSPPSLPPSPARPTRQRQR